MHARYQELISLRDGEPTDVCVAEHVAHCEICSAELKQLSVLKAQLQQLPLMSPPPQAWPAIQQQLTQAAAPRRVALIGPVAASAVAIVALLWSINSARQTPQPLHALESSEQATTEVAGLITRSQQLEALLKQLPRRPAVERAATTATIDSLQQRIQLLDLQMAATSTRDMQDNAQQLWSERVRLLNSLLGVRYAEATRAGYQFAINDGAI